jgi:hypothetical protein
LKIDFSRKHNVLLKSDNNQKGKKQPSKSGQLVVTLATGVLGLQWYKTKAFLTYLLVVLCSFFFLK